MDRLISEKSLLDKIDEWKGFDTVTIRLSTLRNIVKAIPSAEPSTVNCNECSHKCPQWAKNVAKSNGCIGYTQSAEPKTRRCPHCGIEQFADKFFCPDCGSPMEGE